ncbi:hypothetical protein AX27061_5415 [Achromobacter xylosoxidans NBRC 15126 = ATCC 27061]|nr:hypothetical protein AX27061_5415 [Achromobacter xylosoxidans NBRC 15126 = ATCC 27061]CCH06864.1 hypothetical protein NH44784_029031 [Achromobacter xylosoxidans NH44784-1996]
MYRRLSTKNYLNCARRPKLPSSRGYPRGTPLIRATSPPAARADEIPGRYHAAAWVGTRDPNRAHGQSVRE